MLASLVDAGGGEKRGWLRMIGAMLVGTGIEAL